MDREDDLHDGLSERDRLLIAFGHLTRAEAAERDRIWRESERLIDLPPADWPPLLIRWDYAWSSAHHSLDGVSREEFEDCHSASSMSLVCVPVSAARVAFCDNVRRADEGIWSLGDRRKTARVLLWWIEGNRMAPPYLRIFRGAAGGFDLPDCVTFNGGHHRFGVCAATGLERFPAYIDSADLEALIDMIPGTTKIDLLLAGQIDHWDCTCC